MLICLTDVAIKNIICGCSLDIYYLVNRRNRCVSMFKSTIIKHVPVLQLALDTVLADFAQYIRKPSNYQ